MVWVWIALVFIFGGVCGFTICAILSAGKIADILAECRRKMEQKPSGDIKEGIWIMSPDGYYPYCNHCGWRPPYTPGADERTVYCGNCGAKMRKEVGAE